MRRAVMLAIVMCSMRYLTQWLLGASKQARNPQMAVLECNLFDPIL